MNLQELAQQTISIRKSQNVRAGGGPTLDPNKIYFNRKSVVLGDNIINMLSTEREFHSGFDFSIPIEGMVLAIQVPTTDKEKPVIMTEKSGAGKILALRNYLMEVYGIPEEQRFTVSLGEFQQVPAVVAKRAGYTKDNTVRNNVMVSTINVEYNVEELTAEEMTEEASPEVLNNAQDVTTPEILEQETANVNW